MDLSSAVEQLGFSDKEARVYLTLLQTGPCSAYQVAKRSGLKNATAYVVLDALVEKSAVTRTPRAKAVTFIATDPIELFALARSRFERAQAALPELRALSHDKSHVSQTKYFEGLPQIKQMYQELLNEMPDQTMVAFFAHGKDTPKKLWDYWSELNGEMMKRRIKIRAVTSAHETTKAYLNYTKVPREFMEIKGLPEKIYSSNISIEVYKNTTQIVSHRYEQAISIENPDVANVLRQIFEIVWKTTA
jgi:sugar-specific transcriptional regulator TrmB